MTQIEPVRELGFEVAVHSVEYTDPFASDPDGTFAVGVAELEQIAAAYYNGESGLHRKRLSSPDTQNPATQRLMEVVDGAEDWLRLIPSAAALDPLYDPRQPMLRSGDRIHPKLQHWFMNVADARGIRSRAHVLQSVLVDHAQAAESAPRWLSLACGAAQPVLTAAAEVTRLRSDPPEVTLADLDRAALRLAKNYAAERGLSRQVHLRRRNVLDPTGFARASRLACQGWGDQFDVVDAVGLLEYLKPQDWSYTYRGVITSRKKLAGAVTFLRNAFACVKPGGSLVVGNMLDTHPQLGFTLDVVQWPHIQPRSLEAMFDIFKSAGLTGHLDVYLPSDGVYAVYVIRKPS